MKKLLSDFEKEFYDEIRYYSVSLNDLKKYGVNDKMLANEIFLRKIFGDEIVCLSYDDIIDSNGKKSIIKLSDEEKQINKMYGRICEDINNSEFDRNLAVELRNNK